ncbi:dipeptide epimerase [Alteromonas sediminis]|uniref:Dipeptide epimerase n=1 Tax=Alteromonas sediminis TaxID=2259342 RepID=A0A3N5YCL0_9ALTE|nr:dipeptide epimerase [Alteromonas sediminis]RPJ66995.1 dipeptide epimerase [Alteromonas sediminis]
MKMYIQKVSIPLRHSFSITGYRFDETKTVRVSLQDGQFCGRGEGVGVYYMQETQDSMYEQLCAVQQELEGIINPEPSVSEILPPGGARNALDCALWDLQAKKSGISLYDRFGLMRNPLTTVFTIGINNKAVMADAARQCAQYPTLKVKLDSVEPIERLEAIRKVRPDASIIIDANQAWTLDELKEYAPACKKLDIAMIEQPLARGQDEQLVEYQSPVPLGADESCLHDGEYTYAAARYQVINIKLDKCGGLTTALKLIEMSKADGKQLMVGNMIGTSLSMAPAHLIGQACSFIDLDGPLHLAQDVMHPMHYSPQGMVSAPSQALWG